MFIALRVASFIDRLGAAIDAAGHLTLRDPLTIGANSLGYRTIRPNVHQIIHASEHHLKKRTPLAEREP